MTDHAVVIGPEGPSSGDHGVVVSRDQPAAGGVTVSYTPGPGSPEVILGRVLEVFGLESEPEAGS